MGPEYKAYGLEKNVYLTRSPGLKSVNIVVWPESAVPYFVEDYSELTRKLGSILPKNTLLITGGLRGGGDKKHWEAWNSLFTIDHEGPYRGAI